jgi:hypothetical protein
LDTGYKNWDAENASAENSNPNKFESGLENFWKKKIAGSARSGPLGIFCKNLAFERRGNRLKITGAVLVRRVIAAQATESGAQ